MRQLRQKVFFENLNGLRFIAALMVCVFHILTLEKEYWKLEPNFFFTLVQLVTSKWHYGVTLFFVLSGFLISYLLLEELKTTSNIAPHKFLQRRILRIWPLYFLIVAFGFLLFPHLPMGLETKHTLSNYLLFLPNLDEIWFGDGDQLNFLTILWSIGVEEQVFFLLFLLLCIPTFRNNYLFPAYFGAILLLCMVFRISHFGEERLLYYHTLSVASDIAIGGLCAYFVHKNKLQDYIIHLSKPYILLIYLIGFGLMSVAHRLFNQYLLIGIEHIVIALFFAFVVVEQIFAKHSFYKADTLRGFNKAGTVTYGFYVFHCILLFYLSRIFQHFQLTTSYLNFFIYTGLIIFLTYVLSRLSFRFFERPFLRLKTY